MEKLTAATLLVLIVILIATFHQGENFANKDEKVNTVFDWFTQHKKPTYTEYQKAVPDSNVVEYEDTLALQQAGSLTKTQISRVLM